MMAYLHGLNWKQIKATLRKVGAPTTAEELGIEPELIIEALIKAQSIRPERYTILEEKKLNHESAESLARVTSVLE